MQDQKVADFLTYLTSVDTSNKFLKACYIKRNIKEPEAKSYDNSYRFLYYLEHGQTFFNTGNKADTVVKPILYFYGMVHLLKACLLTQRPNYPENTSMLAHGVSTRKRKKQQYSFLQDEVKVQHKGLFPYFSEHLFETKNLPDKMDMNQLLVTIPELNDLFTQHRGKSNLVKINEYNSNQLLFPFHLLDSLHMTENNFISHITRYLPTMSDHSILDQNIVIELNEPLSPASQGPFFYHGKERAFYLPTSRHYFSTNHEIMNHYLLLYNLSMICRYETEWWGELTHMLPTEDYPFVKQFLAVTAEKVPYLLGYFLYKQQKES